MIVESTSKRLTRLTNILKTTSLTRNKVDNITGTVRNWVGQIVGRVGIALWCLFKYFTAFQNFLGFLGFRFLKKVALALRSCEITLFRTRLYLTWFPDFLARLYK